MRWRAARDEQVGQGRQNILVFELTRDDERQTFLAGLVDDGQDAELAAVMRAPLDEVMARKRDPGRYEGRGKGVVADDGFASRRRRCGVQCRADGRENISRREINYFEKSQARFG